DPLMWRYYALLGRLDAVAAADLRTRADQGANPRDLKLDLAATLVERFHGAEAARAAAEAFTSRFSARKLPDNLPTVKLSRSPDGPHLIGRVLVECGFAASTSQAMRLVRDRAVRVDGAVIDDPK